MEGFSFSSLFFLARDDEHLNLTNHPQPPPSSATANSFAVPPAKKKRNNPGNPNPDAEVIALSPTTLMATNRFICDVCSKGFQREQNLQLHRRGHNLPWKLKQKGSKDVRRRVYLCPEPGCVHHDPSRALGDLTGVKKHFSRKHGEKKWKCDKCSKHYAVQSDCKAHSKTCGTREYRCDSGTLFSRRDSFITHRAFCDALAQENSRIPSGLGAYGSHSYRNNDNNNNIGLGLPQLNSSHPLPDHLRHGVSAAAISGQNISLAAQFGNLITPPPPSFSVRPPHLRPPPTTFFLDDEGFESKPQFHGSMQFPGLQPDSVHNYSSNLYSTNFFSNGCNEVAHLLMHDQFSDANLTNVHMQSLFGSSVECDNAALLPMPATALLQKAAEMCSSSSLGEHILRTQVDNHENHLMDIMNSSSNGGSGVFRGPKEREEVEEETKFGQFAAGICNMEEGSYQNNGLTRDFLGVGSMLRSMGRGMALDPHDLNNSATSSQSFHSGVSLMGKKGSHGFNL